MVKSVTSPVRNHASASLPSDHVARAPAQDGRGAASEDRGIRARRPISDRRSRELRRAKRATGNMSGTMHEVGASDDLEKTDPVPVARAAAMSSPNGNQTLRIRFPFWHVEFSLSSEIRPIATIPGGNASLRSDPVDDRCG